MLTRRSFTHTVAAGAAAGRASEPRGPELEVVRLPGVDFIQRNSPTSQKYLIETMCAGVALVDYNNDGLLDIFFVNGGYLDGPIKLPARFSRKNPAHWNRLYRQNKDGSFQDVTEHAGLHRESDTNYGMGVATGDYDNDGSPISM